MKKALLLVAALFCTAVITASAAEAPAKKTMTPEQKAMRKEMMAKYDANGDKKIDKEEAAKISEADQKTMKEAGVSITPAVRKKKAQ